MAKLNVPPTKTSQLRLKADLTFARDGFEMLEQKRQLLLLELMALVEAAKRIEQEVHEKMKHAFECLREALVRAGTLRTSADAAAVRADHALEVSARSLMGISLPHVIGEHPPLAPVVSLLAGSAAVDPATAAFREALESIDRLAEIENSVFRLAREVRKTQRRVNALEKIFIPGYEETLGYIGGVLEERDRDEFIIMRMVKERLAQRRESAQAQPG